MYKSEWQENIHYNKRKPPIDYIFNCTNIKLKTSHTYELNTILSMTF